jgi:hypothetical protein
MVEFNEDGSLKIPSKLLKNKEERKYKLQKGRCVLIRKEKVSFVPPKKCVLHLKLSEAFPDNQFVNTTYKYFCDKSEVPSKIIKLNEKEFDIEIGTHFKRCSDCTNLINRFKEFLDGNVIEEKGSCSYERGSFGGSSSFCFEDYFD